ncbi:MAG: flagellin [Alphaproteobacteria bacterium]
MPSILTNAAAEGANANINIHSRNAAASVGKLSSGSRIVRPADDAASLAISNKLKSNIATLTQAKVNAGQTSSLLQISSGGVSRVSEILTRLKTLSTQAVNGTLSNSERLISQEEFGELIKEIDNTVNQTQMNGIKLLAGNANATVSNQDFNKGGVTNLDSQNVLSPSADYFSSAKTAVRGKENGATAIGFATAATTLTTAAAAAVGASDNGIVINGVTVGNATGGTTAAFAGTATLQNLIDGINASTGLQAQGISARAYTKTTGGALGLEILSKNPGTPTVSLVGTNAVVIETALGVSTASANKTVLENYGISNLRGNVQGVADAVRVSQDGTSSAYKISIDIRNDKGVETFEGTVSTGAAQDTQIEFKSKLNDFNSFTVRSHTQMSTALTSAQFDAIQDDMENLLGVETGSAAAFSSKNVSATLNLLRSDVKVTQQAVGNSIAGGLTAATGASIADTFTINDGTNTTTITLASTNGNSDITVQEFLDSVNAKTTTTGVAAAFQDNDGDGDSEIVLFATDPSSTKTFTLTDVSGTPLTDIGLTSGGTLTKPSTTNAPSITNPLSEVISASTSTDAGTYNLTSNYDASTKDTTFRIQDQKGNVYESVVKDVDKLSATDTTTTQKVEFSNGVSLTFTVDRLADTKDNKTQFGVADNQLSFDISKSGNISVTTQIGLDSYKDLLTVALDSVSTEALGITDSNGSNLIAIDTVAKAQAAQVVIDDAIDTLNKNTAKIGALQSRFSQIDSNLTTVIENSKAANGQFVDVDFAAESSNFYKNQALLQAAVGVAAQANQMPQQLLRLVG